MKSTLSILGAVLLSTVIAQSGWAVGGVGEDEACSTCASCKSSASCDGSASCDSGALCNSGAACGGCAASITDTATPTRTDSAGASCAGAAPASVTGKSTLSAEEVERVASYMVERILATGTARFERSEIEEATGVSIDEAAGELLRPAVREKLGATEAGRNMFANSRCQAYEACSLYGDLSGASGDVLAMYEREKAEDGRIFDDFSLPEFAAHDLAGKAVSSADLLGQPILLAFVAVHCRHSMDSLPILQKLVETYGPDGLRVVAVAINSGEVQDVNTWFPSFDPKYEVWVSSGDSLGDLIGSHLVPTFLFVDAEGRITEKLVGYQEPVAVTERVLARLAGQQETQEVASWPSG